MGHVHRNRTHAAADVSGTLTQQVSSASRSPQRHTAPPSPSPWGLSREPRGGGWKKKKRNDSTWRISSASSPTRDDVLGNIVSFLPTKDGARTQVLSSRWRGLWRAAPLNVDPTTPRRVIPRILSSHRCPAGRRFSLPMCGDREFIHLDATTLDAWLASPALNNLEELEFRFRLGGAYWQLPPPLPPSARRFSRTLRVASIGGCRFPDENDAGGGGGELYLPLLKQLTLTDVTISESSMHSLLSDYCPVLESLLLDNNCCSRFHVRSHSLRSLGVESGCWPCTLRHLIIEDAPCLERLLSTIHMGIGTHLSVIHAPRLHVLGRISGHFPCLRFGSTGFEMPPAVGMDLVCGLKVLALSMDPSLDEIIQLVECSPRLETLYIKAGLQDVWCHRDRNIVAGLDTRLKKVVFTNYRGKMSHVKIAKFFVLNARLLDSMRLELEDGNIISKEWIEKQHRLLKIEKRASTSARFDFVPRIIFTSSLHFLCAEQVHDLSTDDPFHKLHV